MERRHPDNVPVKYSRKTGEQAFLKLALLENWSEKCAWCNKPIADTNNFEIDHIIAKAAAVPEWAAEYLDGVDIDDVENLAPMCRLCNVQKSSKVWGYTETVLQRAGERADGVRKRVQELRAARGLEADLARALGVALDENTRQLLRAWGPRLLHRLDEVDADLIDGRRTFRSLWLEGVESNPIPECWGGEPGPDATIILGRREREAYAVAKVLGIDLDSHIAEALVDVITKIDDVVKDIDVGEDEMSGGYSLTWARVLTVKRISAKATSGQIQVFKGKGEISSLHSGSISKSDLTGDHIIDEQSDVYVEGEFKFRIHLIEGVFDFVETDIDDVEVRGVSAHRSR